MDSDFPTFSFEERLWTQGYKAIAGVDEVGRGALAGPVVAGAVVVDPNAQTVSEWYDLRDSKQLSPSLRSEYAHWIKENALAWAVGESSPALIDQVNIAEATKLAMQRAISALTPPPDFLLIDWVKLPSINLPQNSLKKADSYIISVAAASIIAKVYRDELLVELDKVYPRYGFARHKGYGTKQHRNAIAEWGACPIHRHSFAPMSNDAKPLS